VLKNRTGMDLHRGKKDARGSFVQGKRGELCLGCTGAEGEGSEIEKNTE